MTDATDRLLISVVVFVVGAVSFFAGSLSGAHMAAEHFYDECQGGEVFYKSPSGTMLTAVGCAEIARHVR